MKDCSMFSDDLQEFLDGDKCSKALGEHLACCNNCSREVDLYRKTIEKLESSEEIVVPESFSFSIMREISVKSNDGLGTALSLSALFGVVAVVYVAFGLKEYLSSSNGFMAMPIFLSKFLTFLTETIGFACNYAMAFWRLSVSIAGPVVSFIETLNLSVVFVPVVLLSILNLFVLRFVVPDSGGIGK